MTELVEPAGVTAALRGLDGRVGRRLQPEPPVGPLSGRCPVWTGPPPSTLANPVWACPPALALPPLPPLPAVIGPLLEAGPPAAVPLVTLPVLAADAPPGKPGPWSVAVVVLDADEVPSPPLMCTVLLPPAPPGPP